MSSSPSGTSSGNNNFNSRGNSSRSRRAPRQQDQQQSESTSRPARDTREPRQGPMRERRDRRSNFSNRSNNENTTQNPNSSGSNNEEESGISRAERRENARRDAMIRQAPLQEKLAKMAESHLHLWRASAVNSPPRQCLDDIKTCVDEWCDTQYNGALLQVYVFFNRAGQGTLYYLLASTVYNNYVHLTRFRRWRSVFLVDEETQIHIWDETHWPSFFRLKERFDDDRLIAQMK